MNKFILFFLLTVMAIHANAASSLPEENKITTQYQDTDRKDKTWTALWLMTDITNKVGSETGVSMGYHLNPDSLLLIEAYSGKNNGGVLIFDTTTEVKSTSVAVLYKQFVGHSFYVKGGIVGRSVDYRDSFTAQDEAFKGTSISPTISIGNQWQLKWFTLGCDWLALTQPIITNISNEQAYDTSSSAQTSLQDAEQTHLKDLYIQYARFYLGASF